jgi:hypothetical protein
VSGNRAGDPSQGGKVAKVAKVAPTHPSDFSTPVQYTRPNTERPWWPRSPDGDIAMFTKRLDLEGVLKEIEPGGAHHSPAVGEGPRDV